MLIFSYYTHGYNSCYNGKYAMLKVKITPVGNSMGILLPKEALSKLKVTKGDTLYLVEGPDGYTITPFEQDFEEQMEAADSLMKRYRNTLRQLAK